MTCLLSQTEALDNLYLNVLFEEHEKIGPEVVIMNATEILFVPPLPKEGLEVYFNQDFYWSDNCKIYKFLKGLPCLKANTASTQVMSSNKCTEHKEVISHTKRPPKPIN